MFDPNQIVRGGFRLEITPLGWRMMGVYTLVWFLLFVNHLLPSTWVALMVGPEGLEVSTRTSLRTLLSLSADGMQFHVWQLITAPFIQASLSSLVLGFLGFVFFAAPVERMLGRRGFLQLWVVASLGAALAGWLVSFVIPGPSSFFGMAPAVVTLVVVCCMMTPEAVVPFLILIPLKMRYIALAAITIVVIRALGINPDGATGGYTLGGVIAGWLWWRSGYDLDPRESLRRRRARKNLRLAVDRAIAPAPDDDPIFH
jgi:membrane associated rhomboid family serine protease